MKAAHINAVISPAGNWKSYGIRATANQLPSASVVVGMGSSDPNLAIHSYGHIKLATLTGYGSGKPQMVDPSARKMSASNGPIELVKGVSADTGCGHHSVRVPDRKM
jgi:hypothetical protein